MYRNLTSKRYVAQKMLNSATMSAFRKALHPWRRNVPAEGGLPHVPALLGNLYDIFKKPLGLLHLH